MDLVVSMAGANDHPEESAAFKNQVGTTEITKAAQSNAADYNPFLDLIAGHAHQDKTVTANKPTAGDQTLGTNVNGSYLPTGETPRKRNPLRTDEGYVESPGLQVPQ
jgi:hypothetical protein